MAKWVLRVHYSVCCTHLQVSCCDVCQKVNPKLTTKTPELHPIPVKSPWFHVGIDLIGPINPTSITGNRYILTISDYFSKFVDAVALPDKFASGVVKSLYKVAIWGLSCTHKTSVYRIDYLVSQIWRVIIIAKCCEVMLVICAWEGIWEPSCKGQHFTLQKYLTIN